MKNRVRIWKRGRLARQNRLETEWYTYVHTNHRLIATYHTQVSPALDPGDTFSTDHLGIFPQREKGKGGLCWRYHQGRTSVFRICSSLVIPSAQTIFTFLSLREDAKMVCAEGITSAGIVWGDMMHMMMTRRTNRSRILHTYYLPMIGIDKNNNNNNNNMNHDDNQHHHQSYIKYLNSRLRNSILPRLPSPAVPRSTRRLWRRSKLVDYT
jgi:hypothetical protein